MGLGTSFFLIAVGAILDFAVSAPAQGIDLHTLGAILMIVGALGAILSVAFWNSWGGMRTTHETIIDHGSRGRVVREDVY